MSSLDLAEKDADQSFWYNPVGNAVQPCSSDAAPILVSPEKTHWIEIALVDENGDPVSGQNYKIVLPNGEAMTGTLDERGAVRLEGIDPGVCKVGFPDLDGSVWNPF